MADKKDKKKKPIMKMEDALKPEDVERDEELLKHAEELGMKTVSLEDLLSGDEEIPYLTLDNISAVMNQLGLSEDEDAVALDHKSSDGKRSKWRTKVFISGCPSDMEKHSDAIAQQLIDKFNCEIFSCGTEILPYQTSELDMLMSQMDYIVLLVSSELFEDRCRATDADVAIAQSYDIPILPILLDAGAIETYNEEIGTYELLDIASPEFSSRISVFFAEAKLGGELVTHVKESFPKRLFLSYRKKNRELARELLDAVKGEESLSHVSLWYDDYLVPGEDFNDEIREGIEGADAIILLVTPEILEEGNYVSGVEYPLAKNAGIPVYPVAITTPEDTEELELQYPDIGEIYTPEELVAILCDIMPYDGSLTPEQEYYIGLSYLYGIISDRDTDRAQEYLLRSARGGSCRAVDKLWEMVNTYSKAYDNIEELTQISDGMMKTLAARIDGGDLSDAKTFWNIADKLEARYQQEGELDNAIRIAELMVRYSDCSSLRKADRLVAGARAYFRLAIALMSKDSSRSVECIERAKEIIDEARAGAPSDFPMDVFVNIHAMAIQIYQREGNAQEAFDEGMQLIVDTQDVSPESTPEMKDSFLNFATRFLPLLAQADREMLELLIKREEIVLSSMEESSLTATLSLSLYSTVGLIRFRTDRDLEAALDAMRKAYDATARLDYDARASFSYYAKAKACIDLAGCLSELSRDEEAYEYYLEALDVCREESFQNKYVIYREATNRIANSLVTDMNKPSEAIDIYLDFLRYAASERSASSIVDIPEMQYRIAYILGNYMDDKDEQQAVLTKAKSFVDSAIRVYGKENLPSQIFKIYDRIIADIED